jgi:hypothetical protein
MPLLGPTASSLLTSLGYEAHDCMNGCQVVVEQPTVPNGLVVLDFLSFIMMTDAKIISKIE